MTEQALQRKIVEYLKSEGYSVFVTIASSRRGIADVIACSNAGRFIALEVKIEGNKPSPLQTKYIDEVRKNNGVAAVVYSLDEVKQALGNKKGEQDVR